MWPLACLTSLGSALNQLEDKCATADSVVLYTTMDSFVAPLLPDGDRANAVVAFVGVPIMMALLDLCHLPHGPRIRDRVSHGEALASEMEGALPVDAIMALYGALLVRARWYQQGRRGDDAVALPAPCGALNDAFAGYVSLCHVKTRAAAHLARFRRHWSMLRATMAALHAQCSSSDTVSAPQWMCHDPPAFVVTPDSPMRRALASITLAPVSDTTWADEDVRATLCDLFGVRRVGRHALSDDAMAQLMSATDCGPDWQAFGDGDADSVALPVLGGGSTALVVIDTSASGDNVARRVGAISKCCAAALASLHVQVVALLRSLPRDLKSAYRIVDSVVLVVRVYAALGRICVERFHAVELWDRRLERGADLPLLGETEKLLTAVLSFAQRLQKAIVEERAAVAAVFDRLAPVVARAHVLYAKRG